MWYPPPTQLLPQLKTLNISRSGRAIFAFPNVYEYYRKTPEAVFPNLMVLDASYPYFPPSKAICYMDQVYDQFCRDVQEHNYLPPNLTELYVKNIFKSDVRLNGMANTTRLCITTIFFGQTKRICIGGHFDRLQKLDISDNSISYIQTDLLYPFRNLSYLDISRNKLGEIISNGTYVKLFFDTFENIKTLILSNNNISCIPLTSFQNNNLNILDLSYNKLESLNFGIDSIISLKYLDLRFNGIVVLDFRRCEALKNLHFSTLNSSTGPGENNVSLRLKGNPFSCSCDNMCLLNFIVYHDLNETNSCSIGDKTEIVNFKNLIRLKYECKKGIVTAVFSAFAVVTMFLIYMIIFVVRKERTRAKLQKLKKSGIDTFASGRKKYAVFLSFAGDDDEFVMTRVYPRLEAELKQMLNTESDCVVTGATHFRPGYAIQGEINRCIEDSSVVIFFLTETFIKKSWCRTEVHRAFCDEKPIVLMILGKLKTQYMPKVMRKYYETFTRVHWSLENGQYIMRPSWEHFCETIVGLIGTNN